jgi:type IV secretory pathway TraG/TraD family ATPase VirD4
MYGKAKSEIILINCTTKIILHGLDHTSSEYISKSLGEMTFQGTRKARAWIFGIFPSNRETVTSGGNQRRLLTSDEVRRLSKKKAIVLSSNEYPYYVQKMVFQDEGLGEAVIEPLGEARSLAIDFPKPKVPRQVPRVPDMTDFPDPPKFQ